MKNLKNKLTAALATTGLLLSSFAQTALADIDVNVSGNGSRSDNNVSIRHESSTTISQSNHADISNIIAVSSNTGGNRANDNTEGDVHIGTGDSNTHIGVANFANLNYLGLNHSGGSDNYTENSEDYSDNYGDYDNNDQDYQKDDHDYDRNYDNDNKYSKDKDHEYDKNDSRYAGYKDESYDKDYDMDYQDEEYGMKDKDYDNDYSGHDSDNHDEDYDDSRDYPDNEDYNEHEDYSGGESDEYGGDEDSGDYNEYELESTFSGEEEVPGPGDEDAGGWAHFRVVSMNNEICVNMDVDNIDTPTAAHIHKGEEGQAGPIVITLPTPNEYGQANACMNADKHVLEAIENNPSGYYVNVHNEDYPDGAARGQLY
jgi:hypothetical protein